MNMCKALVLSLLAAFLVSAAHADALYDAAKVHAEALLSKEGKKTEQYNFTMEWMDEANRMKESPCDERYKNGLDTKEAMEACKKIWREMPDFWKAVFSEKTNMVPTERCIFTFDNKMQPVQYHTSGCGYDK